jgi:hypothetical protein
LASPELDNLFRDLLASNRHRPQGDAVDCDRPVYVVSVIGAAPDLSVIDVDLRFIAGRTYCCAEPGCHVPFDKEQHRLRRLAAERAIQLPQAMTVRWHCHVEEGAKLECLKALGLPLEKVKPTTSKWHTANTRQNNPTMKPTPRQA